MQAVFQRFRAKQQREGHGHRAHLQHGDIGHRGLKPLRQHNRHAVTALNAQAYQNMAQRISRLLQLRIAEGFGGNRTPRGIHRLVSQDGNAFCGIWLCRPTAAAHLSHIEMLGH